MQTVFVCSTVFEMGDETATVPPPPWQRVPDRRQGRRRDPLTREAIVKAAIEVLDAEGLDGFSMRRVAERLDTGAASLYWHVGSKDGLLDLILDEVIGEQQIPDPDPERWREQLKEVAREMRAAILRHRDIVRVSLGRVPMGPNALRYSERVLAILRAGGVPDELAVHTYLLLISVVNGFTVDETGQGGDVEAEAPELEAVAAEVLGYLRSLPADEFPNLIEVAEHFAMVDQDARFELLIELFVDGVAKRVG
jgi:AcrR family transcriptional regulator